MNPRLAPARCRRDGSFGKTDTDLSTGAQKAEPDAAIAKTGAEVGAARDAARLSSTFVIALLLAR